MRSIFAALPLALAAPAMAQDAQVTVGPDAFLEGYYASIKDSVAMPTAPVGAPLPSNVATITRIAFGSCNHQSRSQHMWDQIAATNPDMFLFIGDNIYGDQTWSGDAALTTLREAYAKQASHPEFIQFRSTIPMMVSWDDHDFGFNDGGGNFAFRGFAEDIYETFWDSSEEVKARPGIYESKVFGNAGRRVQLIMLDTRFFRADFERMPFREERPPLGPYVPSQDAGKTMLGQAQWAWLEQELAKPADLRILVSSIQVLTDAHDYESWEQLPLERAKLYKMLGARADSGLVILSGDRHAGGIYTDTPLAAGEQLWELTSSSLNLAFNSTERNTAREPDPRRITDFISEENFGLVEIDWDAEQLTLSLRGAAGEVRVTETIGWAPPVSDAPPIMGEPATSGSR
ncbi:alkaline phosphatase D family protein [Parerythrobacter jejuensis]|uniref:Alkaline phosphatase family protein n=1 Tax=Parerythrobacter jejuensis TaxID=795812 RepID=A0A845ATA6_9SPHN|nr:alkaline phosphatase D family protein [Parerythrobacter jejuensis]MXP31746.1 alkaline phosphatase family protein [Parerythrobacter jejuensis]